METVLSLCKILKYDKQNFCYVITNFFNLNHPVNPATTTIKFILRTMQSQNKTEALDRCQPKKRFDGSYEKRKVVTPLRRDTMKKEIPSHKQVTYVLFKCS